MNEILKTRVTQPLHLTTIDDNIATLVAEVKQEIADLKIDEMEVSEENKQTLKKTRTKLNKRFKEFEDDRKKVKTFVNRAYDEFETVYNKKLKKLFVDTKDDLTKKIDSIEEGQLKELEDYADKYFADKMLASPITEANSFKFVNYPIKLNSNKKQIRVAIDDHFEKILSALTLIDEHEHAVRLKVIWKTDAKYDIGTAMVKLTTQLNAERQAAERMNRKPIAPRVHVIETPKPEPEPEFNVEIETFTPEEVFDFSFTATVSEDQLEDLTEFMEINNIEFYFNE